MNKWQAIRDILLFVGGLAGVYHETVITVGERPSLLLLFGAMLGLPLARRWDKRNASPQQEDPDED